MEQTLFAKYQTIEKPDKRHKFQIVGKELSTLLGKPCYFLFARYQHEKVYDAFEEIKKLPKEKQNLDYIIGMIRNKK